MKIRTKERAEEAGRKETKKNAWLILIWQIIFLFSRLFCFIQHREEHEHKMMQTDNFIRRAQVYHTKQLIDRFLRFSVHGHPSLLDPPVFIHENTFIPCLYFLLDLFILILIHSLIWSFLHSFLSFIQILKFFHFLFTCIETFKKWRLFSSTFSSSLPLPSPFYFSNLPPTTYHHHNFPPFDFHFTPTTMAFVPFPFPLLLSPPTITDFSLHFSPSLSAYLPLILSYFPPLFLFSL